MEDDHILEPNFDKNISLFAVFDGHGGHEVSKFCAENFGIYLKKNENYKKKNFKAALEENFLLMDELMESPEG